MVAYITVGSKYDRYLGKTSTAKHIEQMQPQDIEDIMNSDCLVIMKRWNSYLILS